MERRFGVLRPAKTLLVTREPVAYHDREQVRGRYRHLGYSGFDRLEVRRLKGRLGRCIVAQALDHDAEPEQARGRRVRSNEAGKLELGVGSWELGRGGQGGGPRMRSPWRSSTSWMASGVRTGPRTFMRPEHFGQTMAVFSPGGHAQWVAQRWEQCDHATYVAKPSSGGYSSSMSTRFAVAPSAALATVGGGCAARGD
jgi:hypothetical protein